MDATYSEKMYGTNQSAAYQSAGQIAGGQPATLRLEVVESRLLEVMKMLDVLEPKISGFPGPQQSSGNGPAVPVPAPDLANRCQRLENAAVAIFCQAERINQAI